MSLDEKIYKRVLRKVMKGKASTKELISSFHRSDLCPVETAPGSDGDVDE